MTCQSVYTASLPECPEEIVILAQLNPYDEYTWTITDRRFGTQYIGQVIVDAHGNIAIATDGVPFPSGLFNRHAGAFELSIKLDPLQCDPTPMTLCVDSSTSAPYSTVQFTFHESFSEETESAVIGCDCSAPEERIDPPVLVL